MEYLPGKTLKEIEDSEKTLPLGPRPRDRQGHLQRPGGRAPDRRAAPGPQARERDRRRGRQAAADGLRHRDRELALPGREGRHGPGHAAVPGAGAARGRGAEPADRRLRDGRAALRDVHRAASRSTTTTRPGWCAGHLGEAPRGSRRCGPTCRRSCATSSSARSPGIPRRAFPDATSLADAISAFEGQVLDRVLAEVSVTRAQDGQAHGHPRGQQVAGGDVRPDRDAAHHPEDGDLGDRRRARHDLPEGPRIRTSSSARSSRAARSTRSGSRSARGSREPWRRRARSSTSRDAYQDARFDKRTDASSGFKTGRSSRRPCGRRAGEIVGVVEILNKRRRNFTKEDEEFLAEVGTHAALAVASVREHEAAVRQARREGAAAVLQERHAAAASGGVARDSRLRLGAAALALGRAERRALRRRLGGGPAVAAPARGRAASIEDAIGPLVRASGDRPPAARRPRRPAEIVRAIGASEPGCAATAARWEGDRLRSWPRGRLRSPTSCGPDARSPSRSRTRAACRPGLARDGEGRPPRHGLERTLRAAVGRQARLAREGHPAPRPRRRDAAALGRLRDPGLRVEEDGRRRRGNGTCCCSRRSGSSRAASRPPARGGDRQAGSTGHGQRPGPAVRPERRPALDDHDVGLGVARADLAGELLGGVLRVAVRDAEAPRGAHALPASAKSSRIILRRAAS